MEIYVNIFIKIVLCTLAVGVVIYISILLHKTANKLSKTIDEIKAEKLMYYRSMNIDWSYKNDMNTIIYSRNLLEFTKNFIAEVVLIKYTEFEDARDMEKITEINIKNLIQQDIIPIIKSSLDVDNIPFEYLIFSRDYYNYYIIYTTIHLVKKLLDSNE